MEDEVGKADEDENADNQSTVKDSKPASFLSPAPNTPAQRTIEALTTPERQYPEQPQTYVTKCGRAAKVPLKLYL